MKFTFDETRSDICTLIKALTQAEQEGRKTLGADTRALLQSSARMLEDCRSLMVSMTAALEEAARLRAGLQDSLSRHEEITRQKNRAMETAAEFMKSRLQEHTPTETPPARPRNEVI